MRHLPSRLPNHLPLLLLLSTACLLAACAEESDTSDPRLSDTSGDSSGSTSGDSSGGTSGTTSGDTSGTSPACDTITQPDPCAANGCAWLADRCGGPGVCAPQTSEGDPIAPPCAAPCDTLTDETSCAANADCTWYAADCGPGSGTCASNKDAPPPVKKCTIAPCAYRTSPDECAFTDDCRWLTPGCAEGLGTNVTPGCYNADLDCSLSGCDAGFACLERVYDPCANSTCDACGATARVCVQAPPPPPTDCRLRSAAECGLDDTCTWLEPGCGDNPLPLGCYPVAQCDPSAPTPCADPSSTCTLFSANACPDLAPCAACGRDAFFCVTP